MASDTNTVIITGNLTKDPELKYLASGSAVLRFTIASNRYYKQKGVDGFKEEAAFIGVDVWGPLAEALNQELVKGSKVFIEGRLTEDRWETPEGQKRSRLKITGFNVGALSRPSRSAQVTPDPQDESMGTTYTSDEDEMPF